LNKTREESDLRHEKVPEIKIIVTFEATFRAYQGALAAAINILRPDLEVKTVELVELGGMVDKFDPDMVIGSGFDEEDMRGVPGWVKLSLDPAASTRVSVCGDYSEIVNPTLDKLLFIIEKVEQQT
jgi:hypothetical protein